MIDLALIMACAPNVAPSTVQAIIKVESTGNPLAVNVNKRKGVVYPLAAKFKSTVEAVNAAKEAISAGHKDDLGYMQVNSANLARLGYTVEDMFDPCKNIKAGATVLSEFYTTALAKYGSEQVALRAALSAYNTGSFTLGFENGYVARYTGQSLTGDSNPYTSSSVAWTPR